MAEVIVAVGEQDLVFDVSMDDYNRFINETLPNDKVNPAFNLLSRTAKDIDALKKLVLVDGKPNGMIVLQMAGVVVVDMGGDIEISIKKPKSSPKA